MAPKIIRTIDDCFELQLKNCEIVWVRDDKIVRNQEELFEMYNPELKKVLIKLSKSIGPLEQKEISDILEIRYKQLHNYITNIKPELRPEKKKPLPVESAYVLAADFIPIIEEWERPFEIARNLDISASTVKKYCNKKKIESKYFLRRWWSSPIGIQKLKDYLGVEVSEKGKGVKEVAAELGVSKTAILIHCEKENIGSKKKGKWIISQDDENLLRNTIRSREEKFEFCGTNYYSILDTAREAVKKQGGCVEDYLKRFLHLVDKYPGDIPFLEKSKRQYIDERTKEMLSNVMLQADAVRELELSRTRVSTLIRHGVLDSIKIGPTTWTTYSSVKEYKES